MSGFYGSLDQLFIINNYFDTINEMNATLEDNRVLVGAFVFVKATNTVYQKQVVGDKLQYIEIGDFITQKEWNNIENEIRTLKTRVTNLETQLNNLAQG